MGRPITQIGPEKLRIGPRRRVFVALGPTQVFHVQRYCAPVAHREERAGKVVAKGLRACGICASPDVAFLAISA